MPSFITFKVVSDDYYIFLFGMHELLMDVIIQILILFEISVMVSIPLCSVGHISTHYSV
jgi:hypothetical protein